MDDTGFSDSVPPITVWRLCRSQKQRADDAQSSSIQTVIATVNEAGSTIFQKITQCCKNHSCAEKCHFEVWIEMAVVSSTFASDQLALIALSEERDDEDRDKDNVVVIINFSGGCVLSE